MEKTIFKLFLKDFRYKKNPSGEDVENGKDILRLLIFSIFFSSIYASSIPLQPWRQKKKVELFKNISS